jgi:TRAP transporter 4TM/12TM fusion protein
MATEPKSAPALDDAPYEEIEKDVTALEQHSVVDAPAPGGRSAVRGPWRWVVFFMGLTLAVFHIYTGPVFEGTLPGLRQGALHLALGLGLVFLLFPVKQRSTVRQHVFGLVLTGVGVLFLLWMPLAGIADWYVVVPGFLVLALVQAARFLPWTLAGMPPGDLVLSVLGVGCGLYLFINYDAITRSVGRIDTDYVVVGTVGILLVLVAAQRTLGSALVILASLMLAYAYYGPFMPGFLQHSGFSVDRIVSNSYLGTEAVFGTPIWISATVIFLFLIFAAMLQRTGMERFFTDAALGSTGWATGGTAKVGIATSAFSGTITGSSVANTVSNGAFTIPMMKKSGYKPEYAGAVEAASSTGGQIAPPIMGAAAFIMIEFTGVPYAEIIQAALVPAILFFVAQFVVVHFDSKKMGIRGIPKSVLPSVRRLMATKGYLLVPIIAIFVLLFIGFSPGFAAMGAIVIAVGTNLLVQLVAPLAGLVPRLYESAGRARVATRISREGKVELREAIIELGRALRQGHPDFARYARALLARGKRKGVVACALGHRANRVAFALVRDQVPFDPKRW